MSTSSLRMQHVGLETDGQLGPQLMGSLSRRTQIQPPCRNTEVSQSHIEATRSVAGFVFSHIENTLAQLDLQQENSEQILFLKCTG